MGQAIRFLWVIILAAGCLACLSKKQQVATHPQQPAAAGASVTNARLQTGAEQLKKYLPLIKNKRVGLVANHTSLINNTHLLDTLLSLHIQVKMVMVPEHGFRGTADAGATIQNSTDQKTGVSIVSLYGKNKKPTANQLIDVDVVVFDLQDVGARFFTYVSTLHYVMEACAEQNKPLIVLDRPNPNAAIVDGPVLEPEQRSFVGLHPIPVVYGLTLGELAGMINNEGWLQNKVTCKLTVITVEHYTHQTPYTLPVKPSPNLPNAQAIGLYPSLCLFEGTNVSVGRGTYMPFQVLGSPFYPDSAFSFTPQSIPEMAMEPPYKNQTCYGLDLRTTQPPQNFTLSYLLQFYNATHTKAPFFNSFFKKLAGTPTLQTQIEQGKTEAEIRKTWEPALSLYKQKRKKYLLYPDTSN